MITRHYWSDGVNLMTFIFASINGNQPGRRTEILVSRIVPAKGRQKWDNFWRGIERGRS